MLSIKEFPPSSEWICYDNNSFLLKKCKEVIFPLNKKDEIYVNKMVNYIDACYDEKNDDYDITCGIAIAAPQVGCDKNIIYIHFHDGNHEHRYLLANPKIIANSVACCYLKDGEGCLSVKKNHRGNIKRYNIIKVKAIDMLNNNKEIIIKAEGLLSICLQHEIDHLSGILFYHRIDKDHKFLDDDPTLIAY